MVSNNDSGSKDKNNKYINYINSTIKMTEKPAKLFKYCWKCGKTLDTPSSFPFCDDFCCNDYYAEIRKEADACYREWMGAD